MLHVFIGPMNTRKARDGTILVANHLWVPKQDNKRAVTYARKSKPKLSKHKIMVNAVSIGLDAMERTVR